MLRRLGITSILGALALGVGGCSDDDVGRARVEGAQSDLQAAIDGVLHAAAAEVDMEFEAGSRHYVYCGEAYAPRGVIVNGFLRFGQPRELPRADATEAVVGVLEGDGWEVERPASPDMLIGTKGEVRMTFDMRVVQVHVETDCVETSGDVALEASERKKVDIEWE